MAELNRTLMNLNAASEHELAQLPRIGADKVRRIVRYRSIRKGFRDWEDFARTPGITTEDVRALQTRAWIGPPAVAERRELDRGRTGRAEAMVRRPRAKVS